MAKAASDPTAEFFEQLDSRSFEPLLRNASGSIRFDLRSEGKTERWLLTGSPPRGISMQKNLERWLAGAPGLECDWEPLKATYRRSLVDLAALRFSPLTAGGRSLPAAGLPWFMTMFGRDSIFTSLQALPFAPGWRRRPCASWGCARGRASTTSATRILAGSCTRCGTAS